MSTESRPTEPRKTGRIACLLAEGFEDSEFRIPYDRLREGGRPKESAPASSS